MPSCRRCALLPPSSAHVTHSLLHAASHRLDGSEGHNWRAQTRPRCASTRSLPRRAPSNSRAFRGTKLRDLTIKGETEHLAYDDPIPLLLPSVEVLNLCMPLGVYWNVRASFPLPLAFFPHAHELLRLQPTLTATYRFLRIFPSLKNLQLPQIDNGDIGVTMSDYLACSPTERHFQRRSTRRSSPTSTRRRRLLLRPRSVRIIR